MKTTTIPSKQSPAVRTPTGPLGDCFRVRRPYSGGVRSGGAAAGGWLWFMPGNHRHAQPAADV